MKKINQPVGSTSRASASSSEYGGTILGFILGLGVGLGIAFVIAFYLSKNTPQERPGVRAPNLPFAIKSGPTSAETEETVTEPLDLNKPLQGKAATPAASVSDPIGDLATGKRPPEASPAPAAVKPDVVFFLQVGAFNKRAEADAQKASLAIQGIQSQLSEITNDGNTLWRVRIGPYNSVEDTSPVRDKLNTIGIKPTIIKSGKL